MSRLYYMTIALVAGFLALVFAAVATAEPRVLLVALVVVPFMVAGVLLLRSSRGFSGLSKGTRSLSPESIAGYRPPEEIAGTGKLGEQSPHELSRSIVERSDEIRRTLSESPSEIQVEMCAIGYRSCVNDMISLTHKISAATTGANFVEKLRLRADRRRATDSLAKTRQALPPGALRATRQELQ